MSRQRKRSAAESDSHRATHESSHLGDVYTTRVESGAGATKILVVSLAVATLGFVIWTIGSTNQSPRRVDTPTADVGNPAVDPAAGGPVPGPLADPLADPLAERELPPLRIMQAANSFDEPIVLLPIRDGSRVDDPLILVIEKGVLRYRSLAASLWTGSGDRVVRLNPGAGPHPLVVGADHVAVATLGGILAQDLALSGEATPVAQGLSILPATRLTTEALPPDQADTVWVIGSSGINVAQVDVATTTVVGEGSLHGLGSPLGSVAGGLLLSPHADGNADYAVWYPNRDLITLKETGGLSFAGFGQHQALFTNDAGLVVVDLQSGETLRTVDAELPEFSTGTLASPDGSRLAVSFQPSVVENNSIIVFDTVTGQPTAAIDDALPWQFQWVDNDRLLYMQSDFPEFRIAVHDYKSAVTEPLIEFDDFSWWFATTTNRGTP